jgi:hypothetical protein
MLNVGIMNTVAPLKQIGVYFLDMIPVRRKLRTPSKKYGKLKRM